MHAHELRRMIWMVALLGGVLAIFFGTDWLRRPASPAGSEEASGELTPEEAAWKERMDAQWEAMRRERGLPADDGVGGAAPTTVTGTARAAPEPAALDTGVLQWVEDNTEARERAPLSNLLEFVMTRSQEQLEGEVDVALTPPRTGPQGVGVDRKHVEQLSAFVSAHRGAVHAVEGELLDSFPRVLEDPRYPVGLVEEAFLLDRRKQVWVVISARKDHSFETRAGAVKGASVRAVGPLFKVLRVDTEDEDPQRRYKHYPVLVVRSLEPAPPEPGGWAPSWWQVVAGILGLLLVGVFIGRMGYRRSGPSQAPASTRPRHRTLDNSVLRRLDKAKADGAPSSEGEAGAAAAAGQPPPMPTEATGEAASGSADASASAAPEAPAGEEERGHGAER
jgi:hypothetical protein